MAVERNWTGFESGSSDVLGIGGAVPVGAVFGNGVAHTGHFFARHQNHVTPFNNVGQQFILVNTAIGTGMGNGAQAQIATRCFCRFQQFPSVSDCAVFGVGNSNQNQRAYIAMNTSGNLGLWTFTGGAATYGFPLIIYTLNVWYRLEVLYTVTQGIAGQCTSQIDMNVFDDAGSLIQTQSKGPTAITIENANLKGPFIGNGTVAVSSLYGMDFDDFFYEAADGANLPAVLPTTEFRVTGVTATAQGANAAWTGDFRTTTDRPRSTVAGDEQATAGNGNTTTFAHDTAGTLNLGTIAGCIVRGALKSTTAQGLDALMLDGVEYPALSTLAAYANKIPEGVDFTAYSSGRFDAMEFGARNKRGATIQLGQCYLEVLHSGSVAGHPPFIQGTGINAQIARKQWTGNGGYQTITGVGFGAQAILVKSVTGLVNGAFRLARQGGTWSVNLIGSIDSIAIREITSDGCLLGPSVNVNQNAVVYEAVFIGEASGGSCVSCGTYVGDGVDNRQIDLNIAFQPEAVLHCGSTGGQMLFRSSAMVGDVTLRLYASATEANLIQALNATGFQTGNNNPDANFDNEVFSYVAFGLSPVGSVVQFGFITPAGASFTVSGLPTTPGFVIAKRRGATEAYWRAVGAQAGANSTAWTSIGTSATAITSLTADGFTGGATISTNGVQTHYLAFAAGVAQCVFGLGCLVTPMGSVVGAPVAGCVVA